MSANSSCAGVNDNPRMEAAGSSVYAASVVACVAAAFLPNGQFLATAIWPVRPAATGLVDVFDAIHKRSQFDGKLLVARDAAL